MTALARIARRPLVWLALALFLFQARLYLSWTSDDSFITLRYADRLAHGKGLTFNDGERVDVFSNLLWPLAEAGLIKAGLPPLGAMKGLGMACGVGVLLLVALLEEGLGLGAWTGLGALWAAAGTAFVLYAGGGLENPLAALLLLWGWRSLVQAECRSTPPGAGTGLVFALAALARLDAGLAFVAVLLPWAWRCKSSWRRLLPFALAFAAPLLLTRVLMAAYYGTWVPTPYLFKATGVLGARLDWGLEFVSGMLAQNLTPLLFAGGALATLAFPDLAGSAWAALLFAGATLAQWVWVGGDRCFDWYRPMAVVVPVLAPWAAAGAAAVLRRLGGRTLAVGAVAAIGVLYNARQTQIAWHGIKALTAGPGTPGKPLTDFPGHMAMYPAVSDWLSAHAKPGDVLVYDELGYIPFATGLTAVDPTGLTDRHLAELFARHHYTHYFADRMPPGEVDAVLGEARDYVLDRRRPAFILYPVQADGSLTAHLGMIRIKDDPRFRERYVEAERFAWKGETCFVMFRRK